MVDDEVSNLLKIHSISEIYGRVMGQHTNQLSTRLQRVPMHANQWAQHSAKSVA